MSEPLDDWVTVVAPVERDANLADDRVQFSEGALGAVAVPDGTELVLGVTRETVDDTWEVKVQGGATAMDAAMVVSSAVYAKLEALDAVDPHTCRVRRYARRDRVAKLLRRPEFAVAALAVVTGLLAVATAAAGPANPTGTVRKLATELEALAPRPAALPLPPQPIAGRAPAGAGAGTPQVPVVRADEARAAWSQARQLHQQLTAYRDGVQRASMKAMATAPSGTAPTVLRWATAMGAFVSAGFVFLVAWRTHTAHGER
jgi:hypothetical protein